MQKQPASNAFQIQTSLTISNISLLGQIYISVRSCFDEIRFDVLTAGHFVSRAIHDVKATDMGLSKVRFKAEVDFDGRVVTRSYLEKQDIEQILNVRAETQGF